MIREFFEKPDKEDYKSKNLFDGLQVSKIENI